MSYKPPTHRIHIQHGRQKRHFVLCGGPVPRVGDITTLNGQDWIVTKVEATKILAEFRREGAKLRQIFP